MRIYITVTLREGESILRGFDTEEEGVKWLRGIIPRQMGNIAHIHVDKTD